MRTTKNEDSKKQMTQTNQRGFAQNPVVRIVLGIIGVFFIYQGVMQMTSGLKVLSSDGMPSETQREEDINKGLAPMKEYKDPAGKFSIGYPNNWTVEEQPNAPFIFKASLYSGIVNVSVGKEDLPANTTLAEYVKATDDGIAQGTADMNMKLLSEQNIDIHGIPASKRVHTLETTSKDQKFKIQQDMVVLVNGQHGYCVTWSVLQDWYPQFEKVFNKMIDSIKFS